MCHLKPLFIVIYIKSIIVKSKIDKLFAGITIFKVNSILIEICRILKSRNNFEMILLTEVKNHTE